MPAERFFYPEFLEENQTIFFKDQENHHLIHVMRIKMGESIEIINGRGQLAVAVVERIEKKSSAFLIKTLQTVQASTNRIILAQAIPRLNRLDFIIEKCTELGVTEIWLFPAARSEKKDFSENQLERIQTLMIAAIKQCGRLFLPKILLLPPLKQWKNEDSLTLFFGDIHSDAPSFLTKWSQLSPSSGTIICIGPEGGFTDDEELILKKMGAHGIKLHNNILRTDTAAIASIVLLSHAYLINKPIINE